MYIDDFNSQGEEKQNLLTLYINLLIKSTLMTQILKKKKLKKKYKNVTKCL